MDDTAPKAMIVSGILCFAAYYLSGGILGKLLGSPIYEVLAWALVYVLGIGVAGTVLKKK